MTDYRDLDPKSTFKIAEREPGVDKFWFSPDRDDPEPSKRTRYSVRVILILTVAGLWGILIGEMIK